ncbi:hypothetical protein BDW22DRAFT_1404881 [Trametopsis cervina]|nr:hypothetical protein BDW22DRAFT_1404881 [Trametopsis cervina]
MSNNTTNPRSASIRSTPKSPKSPLIPEERFVPVSSVKMAPKSHRPSLTSPMNWLGRSSSSSSTGSYVPSKPVRISEPFGTSSLDRLSRSGQLGAGATVVRTPQEALLGHKKSPSSQEQILEEENVAEEDDEQSIYNDRPASPPLPPLPGDEVDVEEQEQPVRSRSTTPSRPTRPIPPTPIEEEAEPETPSPSSPRSRHKSRPSLKVLSEFPPVPALPLNIPPSPPQAPFDPILISPAPAGAVDRSKIIVSIETSTTTYKATLNTLTSRPSFLSSYLQTLMRAQEEEPTSSVPRDSESSFNSIFHKHLASSGLLPPSSTSIHIFLDRPSAPYAHVLSYLRTPVSTPEHPASLPRGVQLLSSSSSRLEALLELRDEARYLDLDELYKLCTDELRARQSLGMGRPSMHARGLSSSFGMGPLRENLKEFEGEDYFDQKQAKRLSRDSGLGSSTSNSMVSPRSSELPEVVMSPSSVSFGLAQRGRKGPKKVSSMRGRPAGDWI